MGHDQEDTQIITMLSKTKGRGEKKTGGEKRDCVSERGREGKGGGGGLGGGVKLLCVVSESPSK